ncbi:MAG: hypothetical protein J6J12_05750 [Oscillospiraceae bacterium]|nr:hypothetical protein [Oscillospiraceae bacterium]
MNRETVEKILEAQERFYRDPEYDSLLQELQDKSQSFQRVMDELSPQQRAAVDDYMGILHEMQRKLLCCAVDRL